MLPWVRRVGLLIGTAALLTGCGGGTDDPPPGDGPDATARTFLAAIADGDAGQACELATPSAIESFEELSGETGCEAALGAGRKVLCVSGYIIAPAQLRAALGNGELRETPFATEFRVKLPDKAEVTVSLDDTETGWRVDSLQVGRTVVVEAGDRFELGPGC
jgi:hypothetical protein